MSTLLNLATYRELKLQQGPSAMDYRWPWEWLFRKEFKEAITAATPYRDGECNEGSIWEAAMLAAGQHVHNLTAIIDYNKWQATGRSQEVMALEPLAAKWSAFGWHAQDIDGHDHSAIGRALTSARKESNRPSVIIAHTIKGKGFLLWRMIIIGIIALPTQKS